ncbi:kunitz-type trypsin inhibitor alpha chain-like [Senna tora]|uniref:Kunitz-type trypsin inhibitor alpha chain-like n=1 Tax=Senna tora TaxID=362788 RepID=A0A834WI81_9FABA|nr:kunitz-type trypsin inhibitor alpha chain-like [Senna tora]
MKNLFQYLPLLVLLFAFTSTTTVLADFVLDSDGEPIRNSAGSYYILPVLRGKGGGLEVAQTRPETCPLPVVQAPLDISKGIPARFSSILRIAFIFTGLPLNIQFVPSEPSTCLPFPAPWKVEKESLAVTISTEGIEDFRGPFQIQRANDGEEDSTDYKIQYCGREYDSKNQDCMDLGISIDGDQSRRLVVKDGDPLVVRNRPGPAILL